MAPRPRLEPSLNGSEEERISFSLRGLAKLQAERHKKPIRPPITTTMSASLGNRLTSMRLSMLACGRSQRALFGA